MADLSHVLLERLIQSNIPKRFWGCNFDNFATETQEQAVAKKQCFAYATGFADHHKNGKSLILRGSSGTGKTHLASAIAKCLLASGYGVNRISASQYLDARLQHLLDDFKTFEERDSTRQWLSNQSAVDLLIVDNLTVNLKHEKHAQDSFFQLLNDRYEAELPTLIVTQFNHTDLSKLLGNASMNKLSQAMGIQVNCSEGHVQAWCGMTTMFETSIQAKNMPVSHSIHQ